MSDAVLLTGATGFLGTELLARYLERTDRTVYALIRPGEAESAEERLRDTLRAALGDAEPYVDRVRALPGDIQLPRLGLDADLAREVSHDIGEIVHAAASVSFDLDLESSRAVNVEGTRAMLEFAMLCRRHGGLRRFTYVSTAYVAGLHRGRFRERDLDVGQRFRNPYERTKFEAEQVVREYAGSLPITVARPSIIVGDSQTGWTASFNVLYPPLRALARGAFPVLPASARAPVDIVPVDYVADAVFALARTPGAAGGTYHLTASEDAVTIGELLHMSCERLECKEPPLVSPCLYRHVLVPVIDRLQPRRRGFLRAAETYLPYFAVSTQFDDTRARATLGRQIAPAPLADYFARVIDYALLARWGRRPLTRAQARAAVSSSSACPSGARAARRSDRAAAARSSPHATRSG